jgi:2-oxoglutarate decarboxylase
MPEPSPDASFGPNAWLVDEMYERFRGNPLSVSDSWREFFTDYQPQGIGLATAVPTPAEATAAPAPDASAPAAPAPAPTPAPTPVPTPAPAAGRAPEGAEVLRGAAARIVANMEKSLEVPTATSFRVVRRSCSRSTAG